MVRFYRRNFKLGHYPSPESSQSTLAQLHGHKFTESGERNKFLALCLDFDFIVCWNKEDSVGSTLWFRTPRSNPPSWKVRHGMVR